MLLPARGNKEKNTGTTPRIVQVTGVVRLVHGGFSPEMIVSGPDGGWYIARDEMDKLFDLQQRTVTIEGEETSAELISGGGFSTGIRRELRNIRIILVQ
jgi:hypothetical protein